MNVSETDTTTLGIRRQVVHNHLLKFVEERNTLSDEELERFDRTIWRVGELAIKEAVPSLITLAKQDSTPGLRNYTIAWSLGRLGNSDGLEAIEILDKSADKTEDEEDSLAMRRICREVRYWLTGDEQKAGLLRQYRNELPDEVLNAIQSLNSEDLSNFVAEYLIGLPDDFDDHYNNRPSGSFAEFVRRTEGDGAQPQENDNREKQQEKNTPAKTDLVIETLYLLSIEQSHIRKALLQLIEKIKLVRRANIATFKTLWKLSEFRSDAEMFAHATKRLESTKSRIPHYDWELGSGMASAVPYLRRRSWRTLRRLGEIGDTRYVDLASAILLTMTDEDAKPIDKKRFVNWKYNEQNRSWDTIEWFTTYSEYSSYLAFGHILYGSSNRLKLASSYNWIIKDENAVDGRSESFPELWDQFPEKLFSLLKLSICAPVHAFAVKALREKQSFLSSVLLDDWFLLLVRKYEETAIFALDALKVHYADREPDGRLIRACLTSQFQPIREAGEQWLKRATYILLEDLDLLAWMITSPAEDIRKLSREYIHIVESQPDKQQQLLELVIGKVLEQGKDVAQDIVENIRWFLLNPFRYQLPHITFETIGRFISHDSEYVNLLGAQILSARNLRPHEIPPELYGRLFNSPSQEVRAEAVALMKNLNDEELVQWHEMLSNLLLSHQPMVRKAARELIERAVRHDDRFAGKILQKIVSALFKSETSEGLHDDLFDAFNQELRSSWALIDNNQLWRMLAAQSKGAQRVGALMLHQRPAESYTVRQWASLGGNPTMSVRAWAWQVYETNIPKIRENLEDALHILSSNWEDSRSFAFNFFSKNIPFDQWSGEQVIALCDNKHREVQDLGRKLVSQHIETGSGPKYLKALSEHPSTAIQKFTGQFLITYASDNPGKILELQQYFLSVLGRVNKGRTAKNEVLTFLHSEAQKNRKVAEMVARIMENLSLSAAIHDKATSIEIMLDLSNRFSGLEMPIKFRKPEVRGYEADTTDSVRG